VPLHGPPAAKRVSLATDPDGPRLAPGVAAALRQAADALTDAGYIVEERDAPELTRAMELYVQLMSAYGRVQEAQPPVEALASTSFVRFWATFHPHWTQAAGRPAFDPMMERARITQTWSAWMAETPLVLAPICPTPAFPVESDLDPDWSAGWPAALRMIVPVNLLGLPAVAVPILEFEGLPQAVQIIGPRFREDLCLDAATAIESRTPPLTPISAR
jgi:amidase